MKRYRIPKGTSVYPLNDALTPLVKFESKADWFFDEDDIIQPNFDTGPYICIRLRQPVKLESLEWITPAFAVAQATVEEVK